MTGLVLAVLFGLNFLLFLCEGQISLPPGGDTFVVLPGENVTITWKLDVSISDLSIRSWAFLPKDDDIFATISGDGDVVEKPQYSPGPFTIKKNSTLILKNVTIQYNGTYRFFIATRRGADTSYVHVFVAVKPNVTFSCSNPYTIKEDDNSTCVCRGEGGNPPADVTWYKDGNKTGRTGKEEQTLPLSNVDGTDSGTYMCRAQSHTLADNKSIEVEVRLNFKPKDTNITFNPERAVVNGSVNITCESDGLPEPSYSIIHNGTKVGTSKTYTINAVQYRHAGTYKCVAKNKLGNDSASADLTVIEKPNVTINCSSPITVNEGNDLTCVCRSEGGNPPANLTWYDKDGKQTGDASYGENSLTLTNVTKQDIGTYKCVAQRYTLTDEESIQVKVRLNFKPMNTNITITPETAEVGRSVTITCNSEGRPEPRYNIIHNGTMVSTEKTYTISKVNFSDAGTYQCIAWNKLGRYSASANLTVGVKPNNTNITITPETVEVGESVIITCNSEGRPEPRYNITHIGTMVSTEKVYTISKAKTSDDGTYECIAWNILGRDSASANLTVEVKTTHDPDPGPDPGPPIGLIMGIVAGVVVLVVVVCVVVYCYKSKEKNGYRGNADVSPGGSGGVGLNQYELDGEPAGGVDNAYDTVNTSEASGSKSKPTESTLPPVYAAVDKSNREGKPLYATLDTIALHSNNSKKKRDEERPGQTEYASIDFSKIGKAEQEIEKADQE